MGISVGLGAVIGRVMKVLARLFSTTFSTDRAAPLPASTPVPVGGSLKVVDTESKASVSGGRLRFSGGKAAPAYGDPAVWTPAYLRTGGKALYFRHKRAGGTHFRFGWDANDSGTIDINVYLSGGGIQGALDEATALTGLIGSYSANVDYEHLLLATPTRVYQFIRGGSEYPVWTLVWPTAAASPLAGPLYGALSNYDQVSEVDYLQVIDMPAPFNSDFGWASFRSAGAVSNNVLLAQVKDSVIEYSFTPSIGAGTSTAMQFRRTDANNYWQVSCNGLNGELSLQSFVGGVAQTPTTVASVFSNGVPARVVILTDGTSIRVTVNGTSHINTTSTVHQNATGIQAASQSAGAMSNVTVWPRKPALSMLPRNNLNYLFRNLFTTNRASPLPATFVSDDGADVQVRDTSNNLSVTGGVLRSTGAHATAGNTQVFSTAGLVREPGLAHISTVKVPVNTSTSLRTGFHSAFPAAGAFMSRYTWWPSNGNFRADIANTDTGFIMADGTEKDVMILLGSTASSMCFYLVRNAGDTAWKLMYVARAAGTAASVWPGMQTIGGTSVTDVSKMEVINLSHYDSRFATDEGWATQALTNPSAGANLTTEADFLLDYTFTHSSTTPTSVRFRRVGTDGATFWQLSANTDGSLVLYNDGVTPVSTTAGIFTNATVYRVVITAEGNNMRVHVNDVTRIVYTDTSNKNLLTGTSAGIVAGAAGGGFTSMASWPRKVTVPLPTA